MIHISLRTNYPNAKFQSNILIFSCVMVKNQAPKCDDVTFSKAFFCIYKCHTLKLKTFLESLEKLDKIGASL